MTRLRPNLGEIAARHEFFVGIDSDGCVFDTMELKHKECFIPNTIYFYELQAVARFARETWEFVNLYSRSRGVNRFPALAETLELLAERSETKRRGVTPRSTASLRRFIGLGKPLSNPSLMEEVEKTQDGELKLALEWSLQVNRDIERMVKGVPPFPGVRECLEAFRTRADLGVVSGTPTEALKAEWNEHDLTRYVDWIAGQEVGSKREMLEAARDAGHAPERMLMVGDAPGDLKAARAAGALFFPIVPGSEEESWQELLEAGIERFFAGTYKGDYEDERVQRFLAGLPEAPPWRR